MSRVDWVFSILTLDTVAVAQMVQKETVRHDVDEDALERILPLGPERNQLSTPLRSGLRAAQEKDPMLREIIAVLEKKPTQTEFADLKSLHRAEGRAREHALSNDGVLVRRW